MIWFAYAARPRTILIALMFVPAALLSVAIGCRSGSEPPKQPSNSKELAASFVGNTACVKCHRNECEHQSDTNHARSLRHAYLRSLGALAPPIGPIKGSDYSIVKRGDELRMARYDKPEAGAALQYAFGSGASIMTYIGEVGADRLTELRMSYSPSTKTWYTTPSQANDADLNTGHVYELGMASRCVLCHADCVASGTMAPAEGSLGVGCESCHGPGSAHVAAAERHDKDLQIEKIGDWGAERIDSLCGRCHRTINDVALVGNDASNTARFQAYGLSLSPCFKKSGDRLSCITCHDPHTDAGANTRHYEEICLSCHSRTSQTRKFTFPIDPAQRKVCPINAKDKCIGCHLPKREIMPGTKIPIKIADHLIWAYKARD